jgi:predicted MFS family arabinose efflux permease
MTVAEPIRGLNDQRQASSEPAPLKQVLGVLWSRNSFRHMALGAGLNAFCGYSISNWTASFMIRSHGMSTGELGTWLSMTIGLGGAVGVFCGGLLADWLAPRDRRWYVWLPGVTGLVCVPFMAAVYLVSNPYVALLMGVVPGILFNVYLGNTIATTHNLVGQRMRAMSSAILFLILNVIGLGLGPWTIGMVSDLLAPSLGAESLRHAMLYILPAVMFWSICHFFLAARTLREDLANAPA